MKSRHRSRCRRLLCAATIGLAARHASAAPAAAQGLAACTDGRVGEIVIENHSVFDLSEMGEVDRFGWAYRLANALHVTTRRGVIERELLFQIGDCYDVEEMRESERLIRELGFIADAEITTGRRTDGSVRVVVDTRDDWSTRAQPEVETDGRIELQGIELVEDNLLGTGRHFSLFYERENDERVYGAAYSAPQFFRTRADLSLRLARTDVGEIVQQSITYPLVGLSGRIAGRQEVERQDRYFEILMPGAGTRPERVWVPVRREHFEIAAAFRRGSERYRYSVLAAAIAGERVTYPGQPVYADSTGRPPVSMEQFQPPWEGLSSVRIAALLGRRDVQFVRRRGFDTVDGTEDVQLGFEGELAISTAIPGWSSDEDVAVGARVEWAEEPVRDVTWGVQLGFEARRPFEREPNAPALRDVLAEANGWAYFRMSPDRKQTIVTSISAVSGWESRVPFQLTLGGNTGLRGFPRHRDPGGRRVVASVEHRAYLGWPLPDLFDLGSVVFMDVGKIWAGDVPFGMDSPVRGTVGVGIRVGFPPGSRQTFRADVGVPIQRGIGFRGFVFSVGVGQAIGRRATGPDAQLRRSANYGLTVADFTSY